MLTSKTYGRKKKNRFALANTIASNAVYSLHTSVDGLHRNVQFVHGMDRYAVWIAVAATATAHACIGRMNE